ncbi:MAG: hypothetical protein LUO80_10610 [Methylococcaceae bacterium]|jgi:hypothetical protein|nr:hypothetical protein [Methylococcaceae bacterium]
MSDPQAPTPTRFIDRCFRDQQGRVVIAQFPNWPLWTWAGASLLQWVIPGGPLTTFLGLVSLSAIVYWSLLEIFSGVNYFRRVLGLVVLVFVLFNRLL